MSKRTAYVTVLSTTCATIVVLLLLLVFGGEERAARQPKTADSVATLESVTFPEIGFTPEAILRLSAKTTMLLQRVAGPRNSALVLIDRDGTSRTIPTKGPVTRLQLGNGNVYTEELTNLEEIEAKLDRPDSTFDRFRLELRSYDLAAGTSASLVTVAANTPPEFLAADGKLYLFNIQVEEETAETSQENSAAVPDRPDPLDETAQEAFHPAPPVVPLSTCSLQISTVLLAPEVSSTTVLLKDVSVLYPPSSFALRKDLVFYLVDQRAENPTAPTHAIYRANMSTLEREKLVEDRNIISYCLMPDQRKIAYLTGGLTDGQWQFRLVILSLDHPSRKPEIRPVETHLLCLALEYDEVGRSLFVKTLTPTPPHTRDFKKIVFSERRGRELPTD